jgi:spermidine synthase
MNPPGNVSFLARCLPCALAFIASFCVMVVELVAGRVIAKHVGASLYTWTSVIGIVLGGITVGNLVGGRLADRFNPRKTVSVLFIVAALACVSIPGLNYLAGDKEFIAKALAQLGESIDTWPMRIAAHVTAVFLLPATALGLIGPVVAKLALDQGRSTGRTVGNVYAWGALGSIVGTFVTGFYLVAVMGTRGIIFSVSGFLALVGISLAPLFTWPFVAACFLGIALILSKLNLWEVKFGDGKLIVRQKPSADAVYVDESQYSYIKVTADEEEDARDLVLDNLIHAHYVPSDPTDLRYEYEKVYAAVSERFGRERKDVRTLFLGGGGYVFSRYVQRKWPGSHVEVAEIDPAVTLAAREALGLSDREARVVSGVELPRRHALEEQGGVASAGEEPGEVATPDEGDAKVEEGDEGGGLKELEDLEKEMKAKEEEIVAALEPIEIYHMDARNRVEDLWRRKQSGVDFEPFDFIYGDAFNDYAPPFHLVTKEFTAKIKDVLRPGNGIYMLNIIDIYVEGGFLGAVYTTLSEVFPRVYIYATNKDGPDMRDTGRDTFIVVGAFADLDLADLGTRGSEMSFEGSLLAEEHLSYLKEKAHGRALTDEYSPVENLLEVVVRRRDKD